MIYCLPGQNLAWGDSFRISFDTSVSGPFTVGKKIKNGAGAATKQAWIMLANQTLGYIDCIAIRGVFVATDSFAEYTAVETGADIGVNDTATGVIGGALSVSAYLSGRGQMVLSQSSAVAGYDDQNAQGYDLSNVVRLSIAGAGDTSLAWDRGATALTTNPTMCLISGLRIVTPAFNYTANTTVLSQVDIQQADDYNFATNLETLATIVNGSPTDGYGCFGYGQLFATGFTFSIAPYTAARRFWRIKFTSTASITFEVGNVWIGVGINTLSAESWNFANGFQLTNVDRGRYTELNGGGQSRVHNPPYRRYDIQAPFNRKSWHTWLDAVEGRDAYNIDDPSHPWAFALDPDNRARLVTGQHVLSGLFRVDGSPSERDTGAWAADGTYFIPEIPISLREQR